jgi:hypothetical protein
MDIEIEELNLDDFDLELYNTDDDDDIFNIIYSYPYYSDEKYEYEFRISIKYDNIILDELMCDDNTENFDECIVDTKHIITKPINEIIELIKNNKDIRNGKDIISKDYIDLDIDINDTNKEVLLEENKKNVLKELYNEILEYID